MKLRHVCCGATGPKRGKLPPLTVRRAGTAGSESRTPTTQGVMGSAGVTESGVAVVSPHPVMEYNSKPDRTLTAGELFRHSRSLLPPRRESQQLHNVAGQS